MHSSKITTFYSYYELSLSFSFARFPTGSFLYTFILTQQDTYLTSNIYRPCFVLAKNHRLSSVFPVFWLKCSLSQVKKPERNKVIAFLASDLSRIPNFLPGKLAPPGIAGYGVQRVGSSPYQQRCLLPMIDVKFRRHLNVYNPCVCLCTINETCIY